jgi:drug/metabolite transporter (DMT)-like permease
VAQRPLLISRPLHGAAYFQPLIGVGASALLFADKLDLIFGVGTLLAAGILLAALARRARESPDQSALTN